MDEIDEILNDVLPQSSKSEIESSSERDFTVVQSVSKSDRTNVLGDRIDWLAKELDIPSSTVEMAKSLIEQYKNEREDLIGTALELVAASSLYCACKVTDVPLDPTDIADADDTIVTRTGLLRRSKDIATTVGLNASAFFGSDHYIDRYCRELDLDAKIGERAHEIVEITENRGLSSGKSPSGWAAAAVYNACRDVGSKVTQSQIGDVANVSEVTIRNRYQEQRQALRGIETLPSNPIAVVEYVNSVSDLPPSLVETSKELIDHARDEEFCIDDEGALWALAAIRRASNLHDEPVGLKLLSQFTEKSSDKIARREKKLRAVDVPKQTETAQTKIESKKTNLSDYTDIENDTGETNLSRNIEDIFSRKYEELDDTIEVLITEDNTSTIPKAISATHELILANIESNVEETSFVHIKEAMQQSNQRASELVAVYEKGHLNTLPEHTIEETLRQKIIETLQQTREAALDILDAN
ncbi:hypothetical protein [Halovenus amylolytica]|uniref:hypothetical protein n=1 Tax=Halovenus amylolytica TaxID=2500550 RepID=UPI0036159C1B